MPCHRSNRFAYFDRVTIWPGQARAGPGPLRARPRPTSGPPRSSSRVHFGRKHPFNKASRGERATLGAQGKRPGFMCRFRARGRRRSARTILGARIATHAATSIHPFQQGDEPWRTSWLKPGSFSRNLARREPLRAQARAAEALPIHFGREHSSSTSVQAGDSYIGRKHSPSTSGARTASQHLARKNSGAPCISTRASHCEERGQLTLFNKGDSPFSTKVIIVTARSSGVLRSRVGRAAPRAHSGTKRSPSIWRLQPPLSRSRLRCCLSYPTAGGPPPVRQPRTGASTHFGQLLIHEQAFAIVVSATSHPTYFVGFGFDHLDLGRPRHFPEFSNSEACPSQPQKNRSTMSRPNNKKGSVSYRAVTNDRRDSLGLIPAHSSRRGLTNFSSIKIVSNLRRRAVIDDGPGKPEPSSRWHINEHPHFRDLIHHACAFVANARGMALRREAMRTRDELDVALVRHYVQNRHEKLGPLPWPPKVASPFF